VETDQVAGGRTGRGPGAARRAGEGRSGLAFYECEHCKGRIDDHHKPRMLQRGLWATEDQVVTQDGRVVGLARASRRVGVKISGLYSPWVLFGQLASEWIGAQGDPNALADFINQRLAEPFEEQRAKTEPTFIEEKAKGAPPPLVVPRWARLLIVTADTQGSDEQSGYFWYVVRAWGYDYRSQLIDFGVASSKAELRQRTIDKTFPIEGGGQASPMGLWPDSGGPRWSEIYQMAQADQRVHPTKGAAHKRTWMVDERPQKKHGVILWEIDTEQSKDLLHRLIHDPDRTKWMPHAEITPDYCSQMCASRRCSTRPRSARSGSRS
jgi:phage terminase large subunit GpA-like protein